MSVADVRAILDGIARKHGDVLKPEDIVLEATDPMHPLHDRFEWDDAKAAHEHRIEQARALIRSVRVDVKIETKTVNAVYYVRDPRLPQTEAGYVSLPRIRSEKELATAALREEFKRILALLERARDLSIVLGQEEELEGELRRFRALAARLELLAA